MTVAIIIAASVALNQAVDELAALFINAFIKPILINTFVIVNTNSIKIIESVLLTTAFIIILNCVPSPSSLNATTIEPNHRMISSNTRPTIYQANAIIVPIIIFATNIPTTTRSI
jgi:hypothetical protein